MSQTHNPADARAAATPSKGAPGAAKGGEEKNAYRATLNLPKTAFAMKANLVQNEPNSRKRWEAMGLYQRLRDMGRKGRYIFHDGPPYANSSLHLGHFLNKVLKDMVVRSRSMSDLDCPYVPGWDCHGLPIEHRVMTALMEGGKIEKIRGLEEGARRMAIRRECQKHAEKAIGVQMDQMKRMLTIADYEHPYKTMDPAYEGAVLEALATLVEQGLVYRALKAVHWSIDNETALAEAELEYYDREDISVYVDFEAVDKDAVYDAFGLMQNAEGAEEVAEDAEAGSAAGARRRPNITPSFMIWTTTPWTLPANLAIAVNPKFTYALVRVDGNITVMALDAVERVTKAAKADSVEVLAETTGERLVGLRYRHPFRAAPPRPEREPDADLSHVYTVVPADYVTLEDGTGLVHTAPGHGSEDYQTGKKVGLPIYCPVRENGSYDSTVPDWLQGKNIWKANTEIVEHLRTSGHLFFDHTFTHSYPHDWRGKTPVIFRATEQWFIGVDSPAKGAGRSLRDLAQASVESRPDAVRFVPEWGRNRMRGMLESRPDWCISRQRSWGLPIPAFFLHEREAPASGTSVPNEREAQASATSPVAPASPPDRSLARSAPIVLLTAASVRAVAKAIREKGSDLWFQGTPDEILKHYDPATDPDAPAALKSALRNRSLTLAALTKGSDILDVWFESGCSWNAVMRERSKSAANPDGADYPIDLYLEGSDQHRGWFQASLLPALGVTGKPPFRTLLTHGFTVDKDGRKMSKSLGNTLEVEDLLKDYGADVCRWWISSLAYENDIKADKSFFDVAGESYRKVRNTLRFMLSNLYDYSPDAAGSQSAPHRHASPTSLDAWVLARLDELSATVQKAYENFDFRTAHLALFDFCNDTLSAVYLAAVKDRLYCDKADAPRRRRTQETLYTLTDALCRLLAPIMVHTADEAFRALLGVDDKSPRSGDVCIHLGTFAPATGAKPDAAWARVLTLREQAQLALEKAKAPPPAGLGVENPLDAGVILPDADGTIAAIDPHDLADLLGVSQVRLDRAASGVRVLDLRDPAHNADRCDRSWKRDGTVKRRSDGGMLSDRDAAAIGVA